MKKYIYFKFLLIILLPFFSWFILEKILAYDKKKFDELALGSNNIFINDKLLENKILCTSLEDIKECINFLKKNKKKILWIGNSQLHAINQPGINPELSSYTVSKNFYEKEIGIVTLSSPNINFQEYLSVLNYIISKIDLDYIILSLCFDDAREDNVRINLIESNIDNNKQDQLTIEKKITNFLERKIHWTSIRQQSQGYFFTFLYQLRNYIFNIEPSSDRRIIKPLYDKNINSLKNILEISKNKKIKVIMYISPIRNDVKIPYDEQEYSMFKTDTLNLSKKYRSNFYNLENIIPGDFWGEKNSTMLNNLKEIDFMHFKQEGHNILSEYIIKILAQYF